jgi:hypothetical protein
MWVLDNMGELTHTNCDMCEEPTTAQMTIQIANIIVAEVCDSHATVMIEEIRAKLKTKPGPPDQYVSPQEEKVFKSKSRK